MPRLPAVILSLHLAVMLHVDWHFARPHHHRLSLDWPYHWVATAIVFGIAGWIIARTWTNYRWRLGAVVFLAALVLAQVIEPLLESVIYDHRFAYHVEPARWAAFAQAVAASMVTYWSALWLCARPMRSMSAAH